ncbi:MAG: peptide chain release factor N(5)-glutamine methyltransferase [Desulfobacteraceae bacterium]|jgi:release factor glutamine methyltransferase
MSTKTWTIKELLKVTTDYLAKKEIESPRLSAEILLAHQLDMDRVKLYLRFDQPLHDKEVTGYRSLIKRRLNREPIQYITGVQEFWSMDFAVGPQVMVPRPETELLVEHALALCRQKRSTEGSCGRILDLGTGCGAIAVAIARELEGVAVWASDVSQEALDVARRNAKKHGVEERIEFVLSDLWENLSGQELTFDVIVSNPPYIKSRAMASLPPEVRGYEPWHALDGGEEGMLYITDIIREAPRHLNPGGWILLEMDPDQTEQALGLLEASDSYGQKVRLKDYSHTYRVVMAQKIDEPKP